jgi:molybdenum-dependent DNA-binding transcriptional regulator ModE
MEQEKGRKGPRREEGRQSLDERAQALIKAFKALNDQLAKVGTKLQHQRGSAPYA